MIECRYVESEITVLDIRNVGNARNSFTIEFTIEFISSIYKFIDEDKCFCLSRRLTFDFNN